MLSGNEPWKDYTSNEIVKNVLNGKRPHISSKWNIELSNLMEVCWSQLPEDRPTMKEVVDYYERNLKKYINEYQQEGLENANIDVGLENTNLEIKNDINDGNFVQNKFDYYDKSSYYNLRGTKTNKL